MAEDYKAKAGEILQGLVDVIIVTSGVMLSFVWGLMRVQTQSIPGLVYVRASSVFLVVAIFLGLLTLQFSISKALEGENPPAADSVGATFLLTWVCFLIGATMIAVAVFQ